MTEVKIPLGGITTDAHGWLNLPASSYPSLYQGTPMFCYVKYCSKLVLFYNGTIAGQGRLFYFIVLDDLTLQGIPNYAFESNAEAVFISLNQ